MRIIRNSQQRRQASREQRMHADVMISEEQRAEDALAFMGLTKHIASLVVVTNHYTRFLNKGKKGVNEEKLKRETVRLTSAVIDRMQHATAFGVTVHPVSAELNDGAHMQMDLIGRYMMQTIKDKGHPVFKDEGHARQHVAVQPNNPADLLIGITETEKLYRSQHIGHTALVSSNGINRLGIDYQQAMGGSAFLLQGTNPPEWELIRSGSAMKTR